VPTKKRYAREGNEDDRPKQKRTQKSKFETVDLFLPFVFEDMQSLKCSSHSPADTLAPIILSPNHVNNFAISNCPRSISACKGGVNFRASFTRKLRFVNKTTDV
jgi:hypothetical protein